MKTFKFWVKRKELFKYISNDPRTGKQISSEESLPITCFGGSNISMEDAERDAQSKIDRIKRKISEGVALSADYEAAIREEVVMQLNEKSVVTRNRYGARVLNTTEFSILDVDKGSDYTPSFLAKLFGATSRKGKEIALKHLTNMADSNLLPGTGWRIYETRNGYRVIIGGLYLDPKEKELMTVGRQCRADMLYLYLCKKQNCYRARLTPKPYRMKMPGIRYHWPQSESEYNDSKVWVDLYETAALQFSVCKLIYTSGADFSTHPTIVFHDKTCCRDGLTLA